jgi:hypothetical protein
MDAAQISEFNVAVGTWAVAVGTWIVAGFTLWLVMGQRSAAEKQCKIQLYLELRREFDSDRMLSAREKLARRLLDKKPFEEFDEVVLNFFEDTGMLLRRKYLDREMIWDTFGDFAKMWWSACREYVVKERASGLNLT